MTSQNDNQLAGAGNGATLFADEVVTYEPFRVLEQRVQLDLNFREKQIQGITNIKIFKLSNDLEYISLDARQLDIDKDAITVNNQKVRVEYKDPYELMDTPSGYTWTARQHHLRTKRMKPLQYASRPELPMTGREQKGCQPVSGSLRIWLRPEKNNKIILKPQTPGVSSSMNPPAFNEYDVTIPFRITQLRDGLHFAGVEDGDMRYPHAYTRHSIERGFASCIFPCVDDRTRVPEWRISLKFPRTVGDALKQPLASQANPLAVDAHNTSRPGRREAQLAEEDKLLDMTAVCSGTLVGEPLDADDVTKKIMEFQARDCGAQHIGFAVGPFEDVDLYTAFRSEEDEVKLAGNAVKVHGYCLPGRREEVCNTCQPLAHATDFFTLNFSKYPYDEGSFKMCFVDDMVEDTVPLQSFALCSSRLLYPERIIDPEIDITRKLVHTLASQYFGIFINPNEITDTWIVVGLAYYMTDLYLRKLCGNNYYRYQVRVAAERLTEVDYGRPSLNELGRVLSLGEFEMDFLALKAPLIIFILDRRLLKSSNSSGVTRVISQRLRDAMQAPDLSAVNFVISSDQFRRQCEKRGRLRLEDFWDQWVMSSGCPRFHVTQRFNKKRLEVEVLVAQNQVKWSQEPHELQKEEFWRDIIEERHGVEASEVPLTFTGPMTFRVHEADGTPYEHCLEIKLDAAATKGSKLSMPYNTKYKRIKRVRQKKRDKEQVRTITRDPDRMDEDGEEEEEQKNHTLTTFGDVLVSEEEMALWKLVDWDDDQQASMDQESYEWIRVDCDFEWIYSLETNFKVYMTVAQLQQDRDIAGQVEAMLALTRNQPSNIQTTMLLRTLFDNRYFYGIRTMAANALTGHAEPANNFRGMHHLIRTFETCFCFPGTSTPRPNDFSNKKEYYIQAAIPLALARIRGGKAFCPQPARQLILDQLRFNNNDENPYSDQFYVAKLLHALATSLVRAPTENPLQNEMTQEIELFLEEALATIERYEKMDEWACSHNNIITVTALDCKMKLMKCGVIKVDPLAFIQYLNPQTDDLIQVKAYESLIELGFLLRGSVMKLLLAEIGTHRSPFVRVQLFNALTRGLAAIAFGEQEMTEEPDSGSGARQADEDADGDILLDDDNDGGLIIEQSDDIIRRKQESIARQIDITTAVKHLKQTLQDNEDLQKEIWKTVDSPGVGLAEKRNLLELCALLFPEDYEMMVTMKYPARWTVHRGAHRPGRSLVLQFKPAYKTQLKNKREDPASAKTSEPSGSSVVPPPIAATPAASAPPPVSAPPPAAVTAAPLHAAPPEKAKEKEKEKPRKNLIKLSRSGTISKTTERSPAPVPTTLPKLASPAPKIASPAPKIASPAPKIASPASTPAPVATPTVRQPLVSAAPPRPVASEQADSISVQSRPAGILTPAALSVVSTTTPEPSRPILNSKAAKILKKRKLIEVEKDTASPRPVKRKIVTWKYKEKISSGRWGEISRILSSKRGGPTATSSLQRGSPRSNVDVATASFTSSLSAGSSSSHAPTPSQQKTSLPNGKIRKPLPSGTKPGSSMSPPARPSAGPRSLSQSSQILSAQTPRILSPGLKRSSAEPSQRPRKIIKLQAKSKAIAELVEAACRPRSHTKISYTPSSSSKLGDK